VQALLQVVSSFRLGDGRSNGRGSGRAPATPGYAEPSALGQPRDQRHLT
jgi:hypothetical protein